jgi:hypothetical protein
MKVVRQTIFVASLILVLSPILYSQGSDRLSPDEFSVDVEWLGTTLTLGRSIDSETISSLVEADASVETRSYGENSSVWKTYRVRGIQVGFFTDDRIVREIVLMDSRYSTYRGISPGDSIQSVQAAYSSELKEVTWYPNQTIKAVSSPDPVDHYGARTYVIEFFPRNETVQEIVVRIMSGAI